MKQITLTAAEFCIIILAIFGIVLLIERITYPSLYLQPAPVVNVTVNLPESKPSELTAGDYVKGLLQIGWNKTWETVLSPIGWLVGLFH